MQVLIADDSPIVQERLKEMLESVPGVEKIFTAGDTKAALNIIKENHLDAAILDIRMPGGGGIRVLQEMTQESRPRVVIMLTNHPEPQFRQFCFDNGADYFFDKSSEFESVADAVASSADKDELRNAVHKTALKQIVTLSKEKQRHAAALRRKDAILNAVGFAAEQFLEAEYWEEKGSIVLERLGQAAAASRCYIFRNYTGDDGEPWTRQICEWCSSRFVSQLGNPDCISMPWRGGGMERWAELMAAGESVQGLIAQFPESEQDVLAPQDVKSIMAIPVFVGRAWWGFIGLDDCEMEREWIDAEADALQAAARTLATAISKQEKETQLRESEARYSDLVNSIREVVCIFDAEGRFEYVGQGQALKKLGYEPSDLLGRPFAEFIYGDDLPNAMRDFESLLGGSLARNEYRVHAGDGSVRWIRVSSTPRIVNDVFSGFYTILDDITDERRLKEVQAETDYRIQRIFDAIPVPVFYKDRDGVYQACNSTFARWILGLEAEQVVGKSLDDLSEHVPADLHQRYAKADRELLNQPGWQQYETEVQCADGVRRQFSLSKATVQSSSGRIVGIVGAMLDLSEHQRLTDQLKASQKNLADIIQRSLDGILVLNGDSRILFGNSAAAEMLGVDINHLERHRFRVEFEPDSIHDYELADVGFREGRVEVVTLRTTWNDQSAMLVQIRDVGARRKAEQEAVRSAKVESLELVAGGVAHDFNNILTAVIGNLSFVRLEQTLNERASAALNDAELAAARAQSLTQQLLSFAKGGPPTKKVGSLSEVIRDTIQFILSGSRSKCHFIIPDDLWSVNMDEGQISQVIENLAINASQSMSEGGNLFIHVENLVLDERDVQNLPNLQPGKHVRITLTDEGCGIPADVLVRIFDPYFTTKENGNGLGLAVCRDVIRKHDGYINVRSTAGKGTIFTIYLPALGLTATDASQEKKVIKRGSGRVLVMDDEESIRMVLKRMLQKLGYEADMCPDGEAAVRLYREAMESNHPYGAVLLDMTIVGGMGGEATFEQLKEMDPSVKAIVSSGYVDNEMLTQYIGKGFTGAAPKPYSAQKLSQILYDAISKRNERTSTVKQ